MRVGSRRKSLRRARSKSVYAGLATAISSYGALALGVTLVVPNSDSGAYDLPPTEYVASANDAPITGNGNRAPVQWLDSDNMEENDRPGTHPSPDSHGSVPEDRHGDEQAFSSQENAPADEAENSDNFDQIALLDQAEGQDTYGADPGNSYSNRYGRAFARNFPGGGASSNPEPLSGTPDQQTPDQQTDAPGRNILDNFPDQVSTSPDLDPFNGRRAQTPAPGVGGDGSDEASLPDADVQIPDRLRQNFLPDNSPQDESTDTDPGDDPQSSNGPLTRMMQSDPDEIATEVPEPTVSGLMSFTLLAMWFLRPSRRYRLG